MFLAGLTLSLGLVGCGSSKTSASESTPTSPSTTSTSSGEPTLAAPTSSARTEASGLSLCKWIKAHGDDTGGGVITQERKLAAEAGGKLGDDVAALADASESDLSKALAAYGVVVGDCRDVGVVLPLPSS